MVDIALRMISHLKRAGFISCRGFLVVAVLMSGGCVSAEQIIFAPGFDGQIADEELEELDVKQVELTTDDGESIHALYLPNEQSDYLIIYFHGNGGNIHQRMAALQKLRSLNSNVLAVSYRGYLNSSGSPSEQGLNLDARAAFEYASENPGFSNDEIIVLGRSLGAAVAINLVRDKLVRGVVLVTPFTNPRDMLEIQSLPLRLLVGNRNDFLDSAFQNSQRVKSFKSPTLVIHGTADEIIPFSQGRRIFDLVPSEKHFLALDGATHNNFGFVDKSAADTLYWQAIGNMLGQGS